MKSTLLSLTALGACISLVGCHSSIKPLEPIQSVQNNCRHGSPKGPGILSIMASIADIPPVYTSSSTKSVQQRYAKIGGIIVHWKDLALYLPTAAKIDGDAQGYLHITDAALDAPAADAQARMVLVHMHGHRGTGWYKTNAFDVQDPCIEGNSKS